MQYDNTSTIIIFSVYFVVIAAFCAFQLYLWSKYSGERDRTRPKTAERDLFSTTKITISPHDQLLGSLSAISHDVIEIRKAIERLAKEMGNAKGKMR